MTGINELYNTYQEKLQQSTQDREQLNQLHHYATEEAPQTLSFDSNDWQELINNIYNLDQCTKEEFLAKPSNYHKLDQGCLDKLQVSLGSFKAKEKPLQERIAAMKNFFKHAFVIDNTYQTRISVFFKEYLTITALEQLMQATKPVFEKLLQSNKIKDTQLPNDFNSFTADQLQQLLNLIETPELQEEQAIQDLQHDRDAPTITKNLQAIVLILATNPTAISAANLTNIAQQPEAQDINPELNQPLSAAAIARIYNLDQCTEQKFLAKPCGNYDRLDQGCIATLKESLKNFKQEDQPLYTRITAMNKFFDSTFLIDKTYDTRRFVFKTEYETITALEQLMQKTTESFQQLLQDQDKRNMIIFRGLPTDLKQCRVDQLQQLLNLLNTQNDNNDTASQTIINNLNQILPIFAKNSTAAHTTEIGAINLLSILHTRVTNNDMRQAYTQLQNNLTQKPPASINDMKTNIQLIYPQLYELLMKLQTDLKNDKTPKLIFIHDPDKLSLNDLEKLHAYLQNDTNQNLASIKETVDNIYNIFTDNQAPQPQTSPSQKIYEIYKLAHLAPTSFKGDQEDLDDGCVTLFRSSFSQFIIKNQSLENRITGMNKFFDRHVSFIDQTYDARQTKYREVYETITTLKHLWDNAHNAFKALNTSDQDKILNRLRLERFQDLKEEHLQELHAFLQSEYVGNPNANVVAPITLIQNVAKILEFFPSTTALEQNSPPPVTAQSLFQNILRYLKITLLSTSNLTDQQQHIDDYLKLETLNPEKIRIYDLANKPHDKLNQKLYKHLMRIHEQVSKLQEDTNPTVYPLSELLSDKNHPTLGDLVKLNDYLSNHHVNHLYTQTHPTLLKQLDAIIKSFEFKTQQLVPIDNDAQGRQPAQNIFTQTFNWIMGKFKNKQLLPKRIAYVPPQTYVSEMNSLVLCLKEPEKPDQDTIDTLKTLKSEHIVKIDLRKKLLNIKISSLQQQLSGFDQESLHMSWLPHDNGINKTLKWLHQLFTGPKEQQQEKKSAMLKKLNFLQPLACCLNRINYYELNEHQKSFNFIKDFYYKPYDSAKQFLADVNLANLQHNQHELETAVKNLKQSIEELNKQNLTNTPEELKNILSNKKFTELTLSELEEAIQHLIPLAASNIVTRAVRLQEDIATVKNLLKFNRLTGDNQDNINKIAQYRYYSNPTVPFLDRIESYYDDLLYNQLVLLQQPGAISSEELAQLKVNILYIKQCTQNTPCRFEKSKDKFFELIGASVDPKLQQAIKSIKDSLPQDLEDKSDPNASWYTKIGTYLNKKNFPPQHLLPDTQSLIKMLKNNISEPYIMNHKESGLPLYNRIAQLKDYVAQLRIHTFEHENLTRIPATAQQLGAIISDIDTLHSTMEEIIADAVLIADTESIQEQEKVLSFPIHINDNACLQQLLLVESDPNHPDKGQLNAAQYQAFLRNARLWELHIWHKWATKQNNTNQAWQTHLAKLQTILHQCPEYTPTNQQKFSEISDHLCHMIATKKVDVASYKKEESCQKIYDRCRGDRNILFKLWNLGCNLVKAIFTFPNNTTQSTSTHIIKTSLPVQPQTDAQQPNNPSPRISMFNTTQPSNSSPQPEQQSTGPSPEQQSTEPSPDQQRRKF